MPSIVTLVRYNIVTKVSIFALYSAVDFTEYQVIARSLID